MPTVTQIVRLTQEQRVGIDTLIKTALEHEEISESEFSRLMALDYGQRLEWIICNHEICARVLGLF